MYVSVSLFKVDQINQVKLDKVVKHKVAVAIKAIVLKAVVTKAIVHKVDKVVAIKAIVLIMELVLDKVVHVEEICRKLLSKKKSIRKQFKIRSRKRKLNYLAKVVVVKARSLSIVVKEEKKLLKMKITNKEKTINYR